MKTRLTQPPPPALTPFHQSGNRKEEAEKDNSEGEPSPEITDVGCVGQPEVAYDKGEATREVEEDAGFGGLWLVAVGDVGVEGCGGNLEAEYTFDTLELRI